MDPIDELPLPELACPGCGGSGDVVVEFYDTGRPVILCRGCGYGGDRSAR